MKRNKVQLLVAKLFRLELKELPVSRNVKDRLFRFIFSKDKRALLQLYNALNNSSYQDPDALEIITLQNVIYLSMKNDLAFTILGVLNLYEQQSTYNPNMPVRFFIYLAEEFQKVIHQQDEKVLYGPERLTLPTPKCVVLYNGRKKIPEEQILRLSDSFTQSQVEPDVELKVRVLNINLGYNQAIMEKCHRLWEYSAFVEQLNTELATGIGYKKATNRAIDFCIRNGILADILQESQAEVVGMILSEYNEKDYMAYLKRWGREKGRAEGLAQGREEGRAEGLEAGRAEGLEVGRAEGLEAGRAEGLAYEREKSLRKLIAKIQRKIVNNKTLDIIAAELDEDIDELRPIYELIIKCSDVSAEDICKKLLLSEEDM